jgi:hypothetical protein
VGTIPEEIFRGEKLQQVDLFSNPSLTGVIPQSVTNATALLLLDLKATSIEGTIPEDIGNMQNLLHLDLSDTKLYGTIPDSLGRIKSLTMIDIANSKIGGSLPSSMTGLQNLGQFAASNSQITGNLWPIMDLPKMKIINVSGARLSGTIPAKISGLDLFSLDLSFNRLSGSIPRTKAGRINLEHNELSGDIEGLTYNPADIINVRNNKLTGTLPPHILDGHAQFLANDNMLSGTIPEDLLLSNNLALLSLSNNQFSGTLPSKLGPRLEVLLLSKNSFSGPFPASWASDWPVANQLQSIDVSYNNLTGELPPFNHTGLQLIDLRFNNLSGQLPPFDLLTAPISVMLLLSSNQFSGTIPKLPKTLLELELRENQIWGGLDQLAQLQKLTLFDIARNQLNGTIPASMFGFVRSVSVAHNQLEGGFPLIGERPLSAFDASFNQLSGTLPTLSLPNLLILRLTNNSFTGRFSLFTPELVQLEIANNQFQFHMKSIYHMMLLSEIRASNNFIYGSLTEDLSRLTALRTLDLRNNSLDSSFDLLELARIFRQKQLQTVRIENNPSLPIFYHVPPEAQLGRADTQRPSSLAPHVVCHDLTFSNLPLEFSFDEWLFDWIQCDCAPDGYFGVPPSRCALCPEAFVCNGTDLSFPANTFVYIDSTVSSLDQNHIEAQEANKRDPAESKFFHFLAETCLLSVFDTDSNCHGLSTTKTQVDTMLRNPKDFFGAQCAVGSRGRLCSECVCDPPSSGADSANSCYFSRGNTCIKCEHVYDWHKTVPIALTLIIIGTLLLSVPMYWVLESRRELKESKWEDLSIFKRALNRCTFALDLGFIPIVVTFLQLMAELTKWDKFVIRSYAKLLNGQTEAVGLPCLFPFASAPLAKLLIQLFIPLAAILAVSTSIGLAEIATRLKRRCAKRATPFEEDGHSESNDPQSENDGGYDSSSQTLDIIRPTGQSKTTYVEYPMGALLSSVLISVTQFFYFGTALTSLEYFFYESQAGTREHYVLSVPWMLYSSASSLRYVSISWALGFVLGIPIAFVVICYKVRHKVGAPSLAIYFGTLFSRYNKPFFWWEIVNVLRKLIIAIILRTINPTSAMQSACAIVVLGAVQLAQTTFQPWKMRVENIIDHLSSMLLISSLFISHVAAFAGTEAALYLTLSLDAAFVVVTLGVLVYLAATSRTPYQYRWDARFGKPSATYRFSDMITDDLGPSSPAVYRPLLADIAEDHSEQFDTLSPHVQ